MQKEEDRTERLDHLGLVAGMIDELDLVKIIDEECGEQAKNKHGYSRDHRPDLKQVVLQLIVSSQGNLPLMMRPDHGNKDDQTGFRELIENHVQSLTKGLQHPYLLMIMSLSLLIYSALEYRIRQELSAQQQTFPNQKKKPTANLTCLWVFYCFRGLELMILSHKPYKISNIRERHRTIIDILGKRYQKIYYAENWSQAA